MQKNLTKLTHRAFIVFIALVLQSQSTVASVKSSGLQIAQQPQPTATQANNPRDWRNIPGLLDELKEFDAKGTPAAKATVQQADSRDKQLDEEANKFAQQKTPEAYRQAILKHQERLKIWQQPEIKQAIPKNAHFQEGLRYSEIAYSYMYLKESQSSLEYAQKALVIFREFKSRFFEADMLRLIGGEYHNLGKYQEALAAYQDALSLYRAEKATVEENKTLYYIGSIYFLLGFQSSEQGDKTKALEYFNQALEAFKTGKELPLQADALTKIGSMYQELGETQKTLDFYKQALQIQRAIPDLKGQAYTLDAIASQYNSLGEYQKALSYYNKALDIQRQRKDLTAEANVLRNMALVYTQLQQTQQALSLLNQALQILQKAEVNLSGKDLKNNLVDQAFVYIVISGAYRSQDNYPQAISILEQARAIYKKVQTPKLEASTIRFIASTYYILGDTEKALKLLEEARYFQQSIQDKEGELATINDIANVYLKKGEIQAALDYYQQVLDIQRQLKLLPKQANTLTNIANVYSSLGDYKRSIDTYNQALQIFNKIGDKTLEAFTLLDIGYVYSQDKQYQSSLDYYQQALKISRQQENIPQQFASLVSIARTYVLWKDNKDSYKLGLQAANELLTLGQKYNSPQSYVTALRLLGQIYETSGEYPKALEATNQALSLSRKQGLTGLESAIIGRQGDIYNSSKQPDKAIQAYNQKLALVRKSGEKTEEAKTLYNLAVNERDRGNLKQAEIYIQETIKIVENVRSQVKGEDLRTSYFATVQNYYKFYIDLLMQLHKKEPSKGYDALALNISESSRARGLIELLTESHSKIRKGASPEFLAEESRLQLLIDSKEKLRFELVNSDKAKNPNSQATVEKLKTEIANLLNQQKELEIKIRQSNPKYAQLKYPQPLTLAQIQQQLDPDTLLLQYSLGEERSFLWVVSPNSLNTYELPKKAEIEKSAINLFCLISKYSSKPPSVTNKKNPCESINNLRIDKAATELSQLILAPVKDKLGTKRLVIVADGALQYIPFAALADLTPQPPSLQGKGEKDQQKYSSCVGGGISQCDNPDSPANKFDYQPLFINHEIVNLPSASTIAIQRQELNGRKRAPKTLAILADPVYGDDDQRVKKSTQNPQNSAGRELELSALQRSTNTLNRSGWGRLDGTRREAEALLTLVPQDKRSPVFDFDANYTWATSSNLNQFRFLHFATHGFVNDESPELSGIILSLVDQQGKPIKGYLRLGDLFNLDYPADLVVLSACETGLGKEIQGEGLVGLTRGLMYAGAERLVVSLWQVNDEGTAVMMQEFYQQMLQNGLSPNAALRAAQLKMWQQEEFRNPNYWAAFTILGEWR